jgi:hypothetical protein
MTTSRSSKYLAAAVVGAFALVACGSSDDASSGGDVRADLERVAEIAAVGGEASTDAEVATALRDLAAALADVAASAPDDLKADAETFAASAEVLAGIEAGQEELTDEKWAVIADEDAGRAADAVADYATEECGLEIS